MKLPAEIARHLRQVHFGGNWTGVNLHDKVADLTWQQATHKLHSLHSIATLVFHMNYYVEATIQVLQGGELEAKDALSFDHVPVESQQQWEALKEKSWRDAETLALLVEQLPESQMGETFVDEKYGNHFRCLEGLVEHCHYHLGQIAILRTMLSEGWEF